MLQLAQMNVTMNNIQAQLNILSSAPNNQPRSKRNHYFWSCSINYTHGSKTCSANKAGHQEEAYYKKRLVGIEKGCKWWLGEIINKTEISNPKISLIYCIRTPPNYPSKNMLEIKDSGENKHLAKQATTTISPVTM